MGVRKSKWKGLEASWGKGRVRVDKRVRMDKRVIRRMYFRGRKE